jgi:hypothetical protein
VEVFGGSFGCASILAGAVLSCCLQIACVAIKVTYANGTNIWRSSRVVLSAHQVKFNWWNWSGGYVVVRLAAWQMNVNVNVIERCVEQQN